MGWKVCSASHRLLPRSRPRAESPFSLHTFHPIHTSIHVTTSTVPLYMYHPCHHRPNRATSSTMSSPPHLCITIHHTLGPHSTIVAHFTHTHTLKSHSSHSQLFDRG